MSRVASSARGSRQGTGATPLTPRQEAFEVVLFQVHREDGLQVKVLSLLECWTLPPLRPALEVAKVHWDPRLPQGYSPERELHVIALYQEASSASPYSRRGPSR
ncbi:hypothetical protein TorRG33x02_340060 [Trema orientale]|uniref:Uncharacterized protein n=1 Tax=Trema orientale TaxID=63057 RepID=A0A2P5AVG2_TREOI|nr:hypothetical protein TorRG33x02_340060 [Trema orientale]